MGLLAGINHVAFISADIDRLKDFYARVFDAECLLPDGMEAEVAWWKDGAPGA